MFVVLSRHVVDASCIDASNRAVRQPGFGVLAGLRVGPFSECGLDESLCFSVGFRGVWPGPDVFQAQLLAGVSEGEGCVAGTVVGHDACDGDAQRCVVGDGGFEEGDRAFLFFRLAGSG